MALETATHINDLVDTNPLGSDAKSAGDNHIRLIKEVLKRDLPLTTPATALGLSILTAPDPRTALSYIGGSTSPFRNLLINGGFGVDTRFNYAGALLTAGAPLKYVIDRWYAFCLGGAVAVDSSDRDPFPYPTLIINGSASNSGTGLGHRIESRNSYFLAGNNSTLSVRLACATGTVAVTWTAYYATSNDSFGTLASPTRTFIASGIFTATTTPTQFVSTIAMPVGATTGIEIVFTTAALGVGQLVRFQQIQLEYGVIAANQILFDSVDVPLEELRCQRYFTKTTCTARSHASAAGEYCDTPIYFPQKMRIVPAVSYNSGGATSNATISPVAGIGLQSARFSIQSLAAGDFYAVDLGYDFEAEL